MGFLNSEKLIVGYDLGGEYSQISFAVSGEGEAETFSQVAGAEIYNIPHYVKNMAQISGCAAERLFDAPGRNREFW